jgi:hypothetical protein
MQHICTCNRNGTIVHSDENLYDYVARFGEILYFARDSDTAHIFSSVQRHIRSISAYFSHNIFLMSVLDMNLSKKK